MNNIILPKSDGYYHGDRHREAINALSTLETIKASIGIEQFSLIVANAHLAAVLSECREALARVRPGKFPDAVRRAPQSHEVRKTFDLRYCSTTARTRMESPLKDRLSSFKNDRRSRVLTTIKEHLKAGHYDSKKVDLYFDGRRPSIEVSRRRRRWTQNQWDVSFTLSVANNWNTSGAPEIATAFNHNFFPLHCERLQTTREHQLYFVERVKIKAVPSEPEYKKDYSHGYVAFIDRSKDKKEPLVGWGDTPETAANALAKARAKEARDRLLKV